MPGGPVFWSLFWVGAVVAFVGVSGLRLAVRRFRARGGDSLSPIVGLAAGLVLLVGLWWILISLNLSGSFGR
jgi:hypothetical protein